MAVDSVLKNYKLLLDYFAAKAGVYFDGPDPAEVNVSFDEKTDPRSGESGLKPAKAREFVNQLDNFGHFYTLRVLSDVYGVVSVPHRLMQSPNLSIIDVRDLIASTKAELKKKADDWTTLVNFYESTKDLAAGMDLPMESPKLECASRRGLKHRYVIDEQRKQLLLVQYVASIHKKLLLGCVGWIENKYNIEDMVMVSHMEKALTTAEDVDETLVALHGNINWDMFKAERTVILAKCEADSGDGTRMLEKVRQVMRRVLGLELLGYRKLLVIILSLPSTVCSAERSFSGLSRFKSKLRTTMRQTGMNAYDCAT